MMMNTKSKTLFITRTALVLALLLVLQYISKPLSTYVTGSLVNLILILSLLLLALPAAIIIAVVSPLLAFLIGIGPAFIELVPLIMLGNICLILTIYLTRKICSNQLLIINILLGAVVKFLVLYISIVQIALSYLDLKPQQQTKISLLFSWPQLVTATTGGIIAFICYPYLAKALKRFLATSASDNKLDSKD